MKINFNYVHNLIIRKCKQYPFVKNQIQKNGVLVIKKQKIDFFSFLIKIIISQQISDKAAESIWKKFCFEFEPKKISIKNIKNLRFLENILEKIKISNQKKSYICNIYEDLISNSLNAKSLSKMDENLFRSILTKYNGIGPWTCDMLLIFFFQKLNIFPEQDLIIKKMINHIESEENQGINFREKFSPFLSILSLHFWQMSKRVL